MSRRAECGVRSVVWGGAFLLLSLGATALPAQRAPTVVRFRAFATPLMLDSIAIPYEFDAPADRVYRAVQRAIATLELKVEVSDSVEGVIGHTRWRVSGRLAGEQPSQSLNCGNGILGPNADNQSLTLAHVALVDPLGSAKARVRFGLAGQSQNVTGTGGQPSACHSTGVLEGRLAALVRTFLRGT